MRFVFSRQVRGCPERCPLCGSKCDLVGEHAHHHTQHHLFPAFHGWIRMRAKWKDQSTKQEYTYGTHGTYRFSNHRCTSSGRPLLTPNPDCLPNSLTTTVHGECCTGLQNTAQHCTALSNVSSTEQYNGCTRLNSTAT